MKPPIPKRVVVKIGNVYCAEIDGKFKAYFQYIADDPFQLNSRVYRIFKKRYAINDNPKIEDIVSDDVMHYIHVYGMSWAVKDGLWYKVGKSDNIGKESLQNIIFADTTRYAEKVPNRTLDSKYNWYIWHIGDDTSTFVGQLPAELWYKVNPGAVSPPCRVIEVIRYGFNPTYWDYNQFKRYPRPDAELFMKKLNDNGSLTYYHFHGEEALQQIEVRNENVVLLDQNHRDEGNCHLVSQPFSDYDWRYNNYISEEEFLAAWDKHQFIYPEESCPK